MVANVTPYKIPDAPAAGQPPADGGPAYPNTVDVIHDQRGLTIRDRFALAALPAVMEDGLIRHVDDIAKRSFQIADAMMRARQGGR